MFARSCHFALPPLKIGLVRNLYKREKEILSPHLPRFDCIVNYSYTILTNLWISKIDLSNHFHHPSPPLEAHITAHLLVSLGKSPINFYYFYLTRLTSKRPGILIFRVCIGRIHCLDWMCSLLLDLRPQLCHTRAPSARCGRALSMVNDWNQHHSCFRVKGKSHLNQKGESLCVFVSYSFSSQLQIQFGWNLEWS